MTGAMLTAAAAATAGWFATTVVSQDDGAAWLRVAPLLFCAGWAYLLLASRRDPTFLPAMTALAIGASIGTVVHLGHLLLFYRATGLWCGGASFTTDPGAWDGALACVCFGLPHVVAAIPAAWLLVRAERRWALAIAGPFVGAVAGLVQTGIDGLPVFGRDAVVPLAGNAVLYAVFLTFLSWLGDQVHPLADRAPRRVRPVIACVWGLPPAILLVGGLLQPDEWLGGTAQAALMPALVLLDWVRDLHYGFPTFDPIQHAAVCVIAMAVVVGLCSSRRWAWLPWTVCWLHDLAYLGVVVWATVMLLANVWAPTGATLPERSPLNTWPFYTILVGVGGVLAFRAWCLTRRGVRPLW